MKLFKFLPVAFCCVLFASCLEINEEVEIKENGSGSISTTTDLSQLIDMMMAFGGEEMEKKKDEKLDTVIEMKSLTDTASNLTADQKALLKDGKIKVKMDLAQKQFNFNMHVPFKTLENYQQLTTLMNDGAGGMGQVMKGVLDDKGKEKENKEIIDQPAQVSTPDLGQITSVYDYNVSNGLIKKSLNQEKYKKLLENPKMQEMQQTAAMGMEMMYTVTYKLPRPVKKISNSSAKLSGDKKTVTIRQNMLEILTAPEKFEYTIEY